MTAVRWMILSALLAWIWAASLLPAESTHTRPVSVHVTGLPAAVIGVFQR